MGERGAKHKYFSFIPGGHPANARIWCVKCRISCTVRYQWGQEAGEGRRREAGLDEVV